VAAWLRPRLATHPVAVTPGHPCSAILPPPAPPVQPQSYGTALRLAAGRAGRRGRHAGKFMSIYVTLLLDSRVL